MGTDAFPYLLESLRVAATSIYSFIALICFVLAAVGIFGPGRGKHGPVTILGSLGMIVAAIVLLTMSVTKGFSEPKRIYYAGDSAGSLGVADSGGSIGSADAPKFHVGVIRKVEGDIWEDVPLKNDDSYRYTFRFERRADGRFYLIDDARKLRLEINTEDRRIFWSPMEERQHNYLYNVIVVI
jgi:hypothetical protein